jgi:hypothetical protein
MPVKVYLDPSNETIVVDNGTARSNVVNLNSFFFEKNDVTQEVTLRDANDGWKLKTPSSEVQDQGGVPIGAYTDVVIYLTGFIAQANDGATEANQDTIIAELESIDDRLTGATTVPEYDVVTLDGNTPVAQWVSLWFRGSNGTFKGKPVPNGTRLTWKPNKGEGRVGVAAFTVPTTGAGEIIMNWLP